MYICIYTLRDGSFLTQICILSYFSTHILAFYSIRRRILIAFIDICVELNHRIFQHDQVLKLPTLSRESIITACNLKISAIQLAKSCEANSNSINLFPITITDEFSHKFSFLFSSKIILSTIKAGKYERTKHLYKFQRF